MKVIETYQRATSTHLNLNHTDYEDRRGNRKSWVWAQRPNNQSAVVVAATLGDKLVVIKEYRIPLADYIYELPAGLVDPGENPMDAGVREFKEETGLDIKTVYRLSPPVFNSPGMTDESCHLMIAEAGGSLGATRSLGVSEDISVLPLTRAAVQELILDSSVKIGAKAYLVFSEFVRYGKII
jgi:ADP-ribose pyrophosphatase